MDKQRRSRGLSIRGTESDQSADTHAAEIRTTETVSKEEDVALSEPMSWYPAVEPPTGGKADIFRPQRFQSIDARAKEAPWELNKSYWDLVTYLTSGLTSDLEKVRVIFAWMGGRDIVNSVEDYSSCPPANSPEYLMKKAAKGHNASFATLFTILCRKAQLPCLTVQGKVKAAAYEAGHRDTCGTSTWAMVHVSGSERGSRTGSRTGAGTGSRTGAGAGAGERVVGERLGVGGGWRFVYPLWAFKYVQNYSRGEWTLVEDTGKSTQRKAVKNEGEAKGHVDEFWFLTDPEDFNFLCHPDDPEKQLLTSPWTEEVFLGLPDLKADFFKSPWKLLGPHTSMVKAKNGKCSVHLQHPPDGSAEVRYTLYFDENKSQSTLPPALLMERCVTVLKAKRGVISLVARLPAVGLYKLVVSKGTLSQLAHFTLRCASVDPNPRPFPSNPENGFGYDETSKTAGIHCPSQTDGVLLVDKGQAVDFSFQVDEDKELMPQLKHSLKRPEDLRCHVTVTRERQHVSIGVSFPRDDAHPEYSLEIYVGERRKSLPDVDGTSVEGGGRKSLKDIREGRTPTNNKNDGSAAYDDETNTEIHLDKRSNSTLDPVTQAGFAKNDNNNTNANFPPEDCQKGGNSMLDPVTAPSRSGQGAFINALNYLLTSDSELHEETKNETSQWHAELQDALATDQEARIREALKHFLEAGQKDPVTEAKVEARQRLWWETRERLRAAQEQDNRGMLNRAVTDFISHKMQDTGELQPATDRLLSLSERDIKSAMTSGSLLHLGSALQRVHKSHVGSRVRAKRWYREAQCLHTNEMVKALCKDCAEKVHVASVMSLGERPMNRHLSAVIRATLSLLGEDMDSVRSSQSVKNRMKETKAGRSILLDRIKNFQVQRIHKCHVSTAEEELSSCNVRTLQSECGTAAQQLYDWCHAMVKELNHHVWEEEEEDEDDDNKEEEEEEEDEEI